MEWTVQDKFELITKHLCVLLKGNTDLCRKLTYDVRVVIAAAECNGEVIDMFGCFSYKQKTVFSVL